jgi:hypothetical protein
MAHETNTIQYYGTVEETESIVCIMVNWSFSSCTSINDMSVFQLFVWWCVVYSSVLSATGGSSSMTGMDSTVSGSEIDMGSETNMDATGRV